MLRGCGTCSLAGVGRYSPWVRRFVMCCFPVVIIW